MNRIEDLEERTRRKRRTETILAWCASVMGLTASIFLLPVFIYKIHDLSWFGRIVLILADGMGLYGYSHNIYLLIKRRY